MRDQTKVSLHRRADPDFLRTRVSRIALSSRLMEYGKQIWYEAQHSTYLVTCIIYISISSDVNCLPSVSSLYQQLTFHANIYALPLLSFILPYTLDPLISRLQVSIRLAFHKYFSHSDVCPAFILQESIESSSTENWFIFSIASSM